MRLLIENFAAKITQNMSARNLFAIVALFSTASGAALNTLIQPHPHQTVFRFPSQTNDANVATFVANNSQATEVYLENSEVTDACIRNLKSLENLQILNLRRTHITGSTLGELRNLRSLDIELTDVDSAGLQQLANLQQLTALKLGSSMVDLHERFSVLKATLSQLPQLTTLSVRWVRLSSDQLDELRRLLPRVTIYASLPFALSAAASIAP